MPARALTALLGLALGLGALLVGEVVVVPMISAGGPLADANLAHALARPATLRLAEVAMAATLIFWLSCARGWPRGALSTLSASAFVLCGLDRLWLLPRTHGAAELVDLVTQAPANHVATFARAQLMHQLAVASACVLLCAAGLVLARRLDEARVRALSFAAGQASAAAHQASTLEAQPPGDARLLAGLA